MQRFGNYKHSQREIHKINKVEKKVDQIEGRLGKIEQSCLEIQASISIMKLAIETSTAMEAQEAKMLFSG